MVRQWTAAVNPLFGSTLHGHTINALACFSLAMCAAGHCHSGRLAAAAVSDAKPASTRRRWERLLANDRLDGQRALGELARSMTCHWSGGGGGGGGRKLLLVLDETPNGEGLRCMRLGAAYRKRLLSIDAVCYRTDAPPLPMPKLICRMLRRAAQRLPPDVQVTLLSDRGLSWPAVMDCCRRLGWGHVMRLQHSTRVALNDGRILPAGELVHHPGQCWHGQAMIFKKAGWRDAKVTALWDRRSREPWLLAARSDDGGPGGLHAAHAYAKRNWCEQSFRDEKSSGFQWDQSHVTDPQRATRLVLVMVLATLLSISLGTWLIKSGRRHDLDPHRQRRLSVFQLGLRWLRHMLLLTKPIVIPPYLPYLHPG
jgi:hypothetical protein